MKILELLKNPIIKTVGIVVILYFGLFANKENPDSLGNRLAPEQIKKNFGEMREKGNFIIENVKTAQELAKEKEAQKSVAGQNIPAQISIENFEEGSGDALTACGYEVEISQGIYTKDGKQLEFINSEKLVIGSKTDQLIEENIIGMKQGATRNINIPRDYKNGDVKLTELLRFNNTDLKYQITILSISDKINPKISCQ